MSIVNASVIPNPSSSFVTVIRWALLRRRVRLGSFAAEPAHLPRQLVQPVEARGILAESRRLVDRNAAGIVTRLTDVAGDERFAGQDDVVADRQVPGDTHHSAHHATRADRRAAGDPAAAGDRGVRADPNVVADLDLVIELDAVLDHRVVDRAAIDRGVGADLDVVADAHAADLRDLEPLAFRGGETKAVRTDHDTRM